MTFPAIVFSFFVALLLGSLLHLWRGGSLMRLMLYLILSLLGFFGGHIAGNLLSIRFIQVGTINLGIGILGSLVMLGLGYWLGPADHQ